MHALICSYCYGGATAIRAGSTDLFQSIVICHPGPTSIGPVKAIKVSYCAQCPGHLPVPSPDLGPRILGMR